MSVRGSHRDLGFNKYTMTLLCVATTEESGDKLQEVVHKNTPVKTGALRESVVQKPMTYPRPGTYRIEVASADPKARWVEFGTPPHVIRPREKGGALSFNGKHFAEVHHPGAEPILMFSRGGEEFEALYAESIADRNVRKFLKARTTI